VVISHGKDFSRKDSLTENTEYTEFNFMIFGVAGSYESVFMLFRVDASYESVLSSSVFSVRDTIRETSIGEN
jgi:hypothetical protein